MNIGQQIAKYRKEKRLTQEQLGESVGVTGRSVSKWETGLSLPDVVLIPSIAAALGITLDELFGIKPKEKQKDLSETIREAVAAALEEKLPDLLEENLEELMPSYLNGQTGDGYFLTVFCKKRKTVIRFSGFGIVQSGNAPGQPKHYWIWPGRDGFIGDYDTQEEAGADLERIFKAYKNREKAIEL
ncbi:MAG: helix-turn-helix transcriptional regulator [Clostridia bacterium]|nr:helix-turn-helix transcriptional regulator [Clostridia bacterium]